MVFVASRPQLSVIANQSADWCGNPPVERNQVTITAKNCGDTHFYRYFSVHFPSNRGDCHDQSADWSRNDSVTLQTPIYRPTVGALGFSLVRWREKVNKRYTLPFQKCALGEYFSERKPHGNESGGRGLGV